MASPQSDEHYQFGTFVLDVPQRELLEDDKTISLPGKAFDLLVILVRSAGQVVTKSELMSSLWPETAVEDGNLTQTVFLLRKVLGDDGNGSAYIRTLPRVGYKFVMPVTVLPEGQCSPAATAPLQVKSKTGMRIASVVTVLVLAVATPWLWRNTRPGPLTDTDVLVLADFINTTGDAVFDVALRKALAFELEQSPFLKVMDDEEVIQTLRLMGRPADQQMTNDVAHEVCVREGQKATIGGSIVGLGKTYQIAIQANNCQTGATLAREQAVAEDKEHVLNSVAKAANAIRAKLGDSLSSIQKPNQGFVDAAATSSLEAFKSYALGMNLQSAGRAREAIPFFERAIELDPNFADAYDEVSSAYAAIFNPRAKEYLVKAFSLISHASERERLLISGRYYSVITNEPRKAIDAYQVLSRIDPRNPRPHNRLAQVYSARGEYEMALEEVFEAVRLEPRIASYDLNLMDTYLNLDRIEEAKAVAARAITRKVDESDAHYYLLEFAYIQDDHASQERELQWFAGKPNQYKSLNLQATDALMHGHRRKAKDLNRESVLAAQREGANTPFATDARIDALVGDCDAARKVKSIPELALCGDTAALQLLSEQMAKHPPQNPNTAALLYQRGLASLHARRGQEAVVAFQAILDHKGRGWPFFPCSYLGMARALVLTGDTAKARAEYQKFLALWKDADQDVPYYIQAKKELAELR